MSNAFDKASLVMLPHAYEEGKLYSLKPTDRSGDFTFSRGTDTATRVNASGNIEKETQNLLYQSNNFSSGFWVNSSTTETGGQSGYDGTSDAWLLTKTGANGRIYQDISTSGVQTFSVYAKANASNWIALWTNVGTSYFDLLSGTKGSTTASTTIGSAMESVGNGWYRCSLIFNTSITSVRIFVADSDLDVSGTSGSIYIQDAQVEQGLVARDYIETTTPVYGGLTDDMPRLDYSGGATCPSLLLEPSRTNVVRNSEYFQTNWVATGLTFENNSTTGPEGFENATLIKTTTSYSRHNIRESIDITGDSVFSVFAKAKELRYIQIASAGNTEQYANFDLLASNVEDVVVQVGSLFSNAKAEDYGNGWYRLSVVCDDSNNDFYISLLETETQGWLWTWTGANNTDGLYIYGAQHEAGSYPTSYIPTYGSSQTRAVDNVNRLDISSLAATYQTLFIEASVFSVNAYQYKFSLNDATGSRTNRLTMFINNDDLSLLVNAQGSSQPSITQNDYISANTTYKIAAVVRDGSYALFANGTKIGEQVGTTPSNLNSLTFGDSGNPLNQNWEGNVNQALVFPTALSDSECIALTTV